MMLLLKQLAEIAAGAKSCLLGNFGNACLLYTSKYAYTLLQTSSYSIEQICERINFHNISYFYRLFKKSFQITPRQVIDLKKDKKPSKKNEK